MGKQSVFLWLAIAAISSTVAFYVTSIKHIEISQKLQPGLKTLSNGQSQLANDSISLNRPIALDSEQPFLKFNQVSDVNAGTTHPDTELWFIEAVENQLLLAGIDRKVDLNDISRKFGVDERDIVAAVEQLLLLADPFSDKGKHYRLDLLKQLLNWDSQDVELLAYLILDQGTNTGEIALLGNYLEQHQPGVYSEFLRQIVERSLSNPDSSRELSGAFFQLAGRVGNLSTLELLNNLPIHLNAYTRFALAQLYDGSGISALEADARKLESGSLTNQSVLAFQLLAQEAYRQPDAYRALEEFAARGALPVEAWDGIAELVAGIEAVSLAVPVSGLIETSTIFRPGGNQVYFRSTVDPNALSLEELELRLFLLEQLLRVIPSQYEQQVIAVSGQLIETRNRFSYSQHFTSKEVVDSSIYEFSIERGRRKS